MSEFYKLLCEEEDKVLRLLGGMRVVKQLYKEILGEFPSVSTQIDFDTDIKARNFLEQQRWGKYVICPFCQMKECTRLSDGYRFQCNWFSCRKQFSLTVGTIMDNTKIPLNKWMLGVDLINSSLGSISTVKLAEKIGITQAKGWAMKKRIHEGMIQNNLTYKHGFLVLTKPFTKSSN